MSGFESAHAAVEEKFSDGVASPETSQTDIAPDGQATEREQAEAAQAIAELDKMDKFKLDGQEWTLKDLKAAILRQKDYTQKTQSLAEERKSFGDEKKFYENLYWDLDSVRKNPGLAQEFVKVYPPAFHQYLEKALKETNTHSPSQQSVQSQQTQPHVDVQTLSRLERLEKFYNDQEVAKNEQEVERIVDKFAKTYPDAGNFKELVLARAYESRMQGVQLTEEMWESIFKQVDQQVSGLLKAKYGNLVKEQKEANAKARDVGAGGGTPGSAPKKFKNLGEVTKFAANEMSRGR